MSYQLDRLFSANSTKPAAANPDEFRRLVQRVIGSDIHRFRRLWNYYKNPISPLTSSSRDGTSERPYRQAQEWGMPSRITGFTSPTQSMTQEPLGEIARKQVVIENDIAWRIDTMVDWLFCKEPTISSGASDPSRRAAIESLLRAILAHNGGIVFLQQLALMAAVYGFADVLVKLDTSVASATAASTNFTDGAAPSEQAQASASVTPPAEPAPNRGQANASVDAQSSDLERLARCIRLEIVDPARALPLLSDTDWRDVRAYAQVYTLPKPLAASQSKTAANRTWLSKVFPQLFAPDATVSNSATHPVIVTEILTATRWQRYEDESLVAQGANSLGELPLVHIQNTAVPFEYSGASDVEMLLPLQDELNTRLSDRAHRITMQSFKMYLGKGIDNFGELPVAPGRMWMTDNDNAQVQEFGGDDGAPGEESHIREVREALDKTSSVTPIAAGAIKGRIGNLTSAAALRVTMMALISKTARKQTLFGEGIARMCELSLAWLDRAGLFKTDPSERAIELGWPDPLPTDAGERLTQAGQKLQLGVPRDVVLRELGYATAVAPSVE